MVKRQEDKKELRRQKAGASEDVVDTTLAEAEHDTDQSARAKPKEKKLKKSHTLDASVEVDRKAVNVAKKKKRLRPEETQAERLERKRKHKDLATSSALRDAENTISYPEKQEEEAPKTREKDVGQETVTEQGSNSNVKGKGKSKDGGKGQGKRNGMSKGKGKGKGPLGDGAPKRHWCDPAFRVFVKGLAWTVDEDILRKDFTECGEVADVYMPKAKDKPGEHRGFAFITFKDEAGVEAALKFDGDMYAEGKFLGITRAAPKGTAPPEDADKPLTMKKPKGCTSLVLKNLSPKVTEDDITKFFSNCGDGVAHVGVLKDRKTGESRCTARADFVNSEDLDEAMALAPSLRGATFTMTYCRPKGWD